MWMSEIAERAIMQAASSLDVTMRASRVDNEETEKTERKKYPALVINAGSGNTDSIESLFYEVPITLTLITHYEDDPKCTTLASLEDELRSITDVGIDSSTVRTAFNSIAAAAGETRYFKGLTNIEGEPVAKTDKEQSIVINMIMHVCGS